MPYSPYRYSSDGEKLPPEKQDNETREGYDIPDPESSLFRDQCIVRVPYNDEENHPDHYAVDPAEEPNIIEQSRIGQVFTSVTHSLLYRDAALPEWNASVRTLH